jgi:hypothetical protein
MNNNQPSFARCCLHAHCITRNPSRFAFYLRGIIREFSGPFGEFLLAGFFVTIFIKAVNLFFQ